MQAQQHVKLKVGLCSLFGTKHLCTQVGGDFGTGPRHPAGDWIAVSNLWVVIIKLPAETLST